MQISSTKALQYISLTLAGGKVQYLTPMMSHICSKELSFYKLIHQLQIWIFWFENTTIILSRKADDRHVMDLKTLPASTTVTKQMCYLLTDLTWCRAPERWSWSWAVSWNLCGRWPSLWEEKPSRPPALAAATAWERKTETRFGKQAHVNGGGKKTHV